MYGGIERVTTYRKANRMSKDLERCKAKALELGASAVIIVSARAIPVDERIVIVQQ